jgi:hypothetical protein
MPEPKIIPLPVRTLDEALPQLRRPFTVDAIRWKIQASFPKGNPRTAQVVPYIDARLVEERLNAVVGERWSEGRPGKLLGDDGNVLIPEVPAFTQLPSGALSCALTVCGVTRQDVGEAAGFMAKEKTLRSDALKRAAVKFGVGVSLYAIPKVKLSLPEGDEEGPVRLYVQTKKRKDGGQYEAKSLVFTPRGEEHVRELYLEWLETDHGFGEPLDHGDAAGGSVGDFETVAEPEAEEEAAPELSEETQKGAEAMSESIKGKGK